MIVLLDPVCFEPHHCGLDGGRKAEGDRRRTKGRSEAEDGTGATLLLREE
ncbi:hypothetical protein FJ970_25865 [Mesorhizobium sp. B2-1-8]|nr:MULTISPECIES: hypothetical protein [unclassified Mesorhizobium]MBZ9710864.1 hypothetical protein [Mesorhizobium sp. ESP7-2]UCI18458.1 hypothetical protein FJ970_25865 [Mesorhizobium sp. B2-1-8]